MRRVASVLLAALVLSLAAIGAPALARGPDPAVAVTGEVAAPSTYTLAQLVAVTQTSVSVTPTARSGRFTTTFTGVSLETLATAAKPAYPALSNTKNELLRVTVTVRGRSGEQVTMALGELDPNFGSHPALLALSANGHALAGAPELILPGDHPPIRTITSVREVTVGIATAPATTTSLTGALRIVDGGHHRTLSLARLSALPQHTLSVTFAGPGGSQTHTETGPALADVLRAAGVRADLNTWVAGVGVDNYVATVTPAEAGVGGRPLLIALVEDGMGVSGTVGDTPRLIADGDVKGGRDDSDLVGLYVGRGPAS